MINTFGPTIIMTAAERTNWSRRRAAAISFLANISLDGSHDNSFSLFTKKDRAFSGSYGDCKVNVLSETDTNIVKSSKVLQANEKCVCSAQIEAVLERPAVGYNVGSKESNKNSSIITPFRERTNTAGSDYCNEFRSSNYRKKFLHQTSLNDEKVHHHFSSSESIGSVIGRGKAAGAILESVGAKEVRFLKTKQFRSHRLKDERLILATGNKIPLAIFSHFPYDRNYKICSVTTALPARNCDDLMHHVSINPFKFWSSAFSVSSVRYKEIRDRL